ncbi:pyrroline-5-carboxylate reductase [Enterovirga sp.]|uniref:pyrroline-5-carboxylate reductase n=1 Tax=Enterovirga sp. TaxID=2026350 RepID=UPI00261EF219|nr:pyrroline-5-carboxylate reductase [Enterovirga sp.]MDB5592579.1 pyrroline-5-carboxylate reductase [Enterovirga sp.]
MTAAPAPAQDLPGSVVLVGAGKMGGAMLEGWLARGLAPAAVTVLDPHAASDLAARGLRVNPQDRSTIPPPEVLVLGIKPQALEEVAPGLAAAAGPDTLVISILAGKTVANLLRALPAARSVVRAMPNLPASIGRGATGAYANAATNPRQRRIADALLAANGVVEWVEDEALIDVVTALSGSGPAYVFHLCEAMTEAGAAAGLPRELASRLARATVVGSAALLDSSGLPPATLRENVTSKGGTTAAALDVLMGEGGLPPLMRAAVAAAKRRAGELSG